MDLAQILESCQNNQDDEGLGSIDIYLEDDGSHSIILRMKIWRTNESWPKIPRFIAVLVPSFQNWTDLAMIDVQI